MRVVVSTIIVLAALAAALLIVSKDWYHATIALLVYAMLTGLKL